MSMPRHLRARPTSVALLVIAASVALAPAASVAAAGTSVVVANQSIVASNASAEEVKYYEVARDENGEPEFLYDIAERYLGNGNRFTEIFDLNEGRPQPGGGQLTDPTAVQPGWILIMPGDAEGEGIQTGPLPSAEPAPAPEPSGSADPSATPDEPATDDGSEEGATEAESGSSPVPIVIGVVIGLVVLAAAAVAIVLVIRRGRRVDQPFDDSLLRSDTSSSWMVDRALRVLLTACARENVRVPSVVGVYIEGSTLRLRLTAPTSPAPDPWVASEDGLNWVAPIDRLQRETVGDESTERFARLVTLGVSESGRVLVDFARARGVISLAGPTAIKHEVLRRWLGELAGNPWSDHPRVVMIGNGLPQPESVEHLASLEQMVPELETESRGVLVLSQRPSATQQSLLAARFASPRFGWTVIVLEEMSGARWQLVVDEERWLRSDFLPDVRLPDRPVSNRKTS